MPADTLEALAPAASPRGIDAMMAQLDQAAASGNNIGDTPPAPKTPEAPPVAKPEGDKPAATPPTPAAAKPATPPAAPAKPAADEMNETAMEEFLKKHPKPWRVYEASKKKWQTEKQSLESKIAEISNKPAPTAADDKRLESLNKQLEEYRERATKSDQELARMNYVHTPEYKAFKVKADAIYNEAVDVATKMGVYEGDNLRQSTEADFNRLMKAPVGERNSLAKKMYGEDNAPEVLAYIQDINRVQREVRLASQQHAAKYESEAAERETTTAKQRQEYEGYYKTSLESLQKNEAYGKWFSEPSDDPEAAQLIKSRYEEIERVTAQMEKLPPDQQAAYAAIYKASVAATPRLILEINRRDAKVAELEAELAKYRGTDPGAENGAGGDGIQPTKKMGINEAAAAFDEAPRN